MSEVEVLGSVHDGAAVAARTQTRTGDCRTRGDGNGGRRGDAVGVLVCTSIAKVPAQSKSGLLNWSAGSLRAELGARLVGVRPTSLHDPCPRAHSVLDYCTAGRSFRALASAVFALLERR